MLATYETPTRGVAVMPSKVRIEDRPDLQEVVENVLALRSMAFNGHFATHRSQRDILGRLCPDDLACVARALKKAEEKRTQPIFNRSTITNK
jgi:hypothetical protein